MKLIYDKPVSRSLPIRLGWTLVTALLWALWISLWAPLLALTTWPVEFGIAGSTLQFPLALTMIESESIVFFLVGSVSISGSGMLIWSWLNYLRFRNAKRRSCRLPAQLEELADYSALLVEKMAAWQKARRVIVHHDEHGRVLEAEVLHREPKPVPMGLAQDVKL